MSLADATTGYALADEHWYPCGEGPDVYESGVYRLATGGIWERIADAPCYQCQILAVDSQNVWLLEPDEGWYSTEGQPNHVWHSKDGGMTWDAHASPEMAGLRGIWFSDALHGWVVGENGAIFHSQDGGHTWVSQRSGTDAQLNAVRFVGTEFGWAVGNQGTILTTLDGGANWHRQESPLAVSLNALYFRDRWTGWIAGDEGVIIHTRTGGDNGPLDTLPSLKSNGQIAVDGSLDEWKDYPQVDLNVETADRIHGVLSSVEGDSSVTVYSAWDDAYLYLAARIYDDVLVHDSENLSDDDAVEFGLDGLHDHQGEQADDHSYTIRVDGVLANSGTLVTDGNEILATRILTDGWSLEMAVPWTLLGGQLATYRTIGFTLGLHDDDDGGDADAHMIWKGWNTYDGGWGYWGHVWLVGGSPSVRPRVFLPLISSTLNPP
jgi:hypothetical protein